MNIPTALPPTISNESIPLPEADPPHVEEIVETENPVTKQAFNVYTNEDRKNFASLYVIYGRVADITKFMPQVPLRTLYGWVKSEWFQRYYDDARREHAELVEARLSDVVEKATRELIDRLEFGDEMLTKSGDIVRVKVSTRDLTNLIKEGIDKVRLLQNKPGKLTAEVKFDGDKLERTLADLADKHRERIVSTQ